jgi:phenylacetate-CoA ligase
VQPEERIVSTYNAGPFVAGAALASFDRLGLTHIPIGTGNTDRLLKAIELLKPEAAVLTPSTCLLTEERIDRLQRRRVLVASEPGGGEPASARPRGGWGEGHRAMGIGDIGVSLWGSARTRTACTSAPAARPRRLIDRPSRSPRRRRQRRLVLTHLRQARPPPALPHPRPRARQNEPVLRPHRPRIRCVSRTDDMLVIRGVSVFPSAVRES